VQLWARRGSANRDWYGKPFFLWLNPTRMHVITHLSDKYENLRTPKNGWTVEEAGMAQLDDIVGSVMKYVKDNGLDENTIIAFSMDNGAENFTSSDGGQTPFAGGKGLRWKAAFAYLRSFAGRARYRPARSKTEFFPESTGSQLL
jgi:arylsulfatase A-like enzyme